MTNDFTNLNNKFNNYLDHLKNINLKDSSEVQKQKASKEKYNYLNSFSLERIKFLSYKEDDLNSKKPKKKEEPKIDIMKLMRYTKRGNKKWFKKELKNKTFKPFHKPKKKQLELRPIFSPINSTDINNKYNIDYNKTTSDFFNNYKNTIKTVRNEANKAISLNQNFDKKIKTMENFFNSKKLPKIEDYDNIINNTHYLFRKNLSNGKIMNSFRKDKFEYDRNRLDNKKEIFESFNIAYLNKKIIWEQEDKKREVAKKYNEAEIEETKNFLREIKRIGRKPNFYTDPYSMRDSNINNLIQIFNGTLTDEF